MRISRPALAAYLAIGTLAVSACTDDRAEPASETAIAVAADSTSGPVTAEPPDAEARPERIYYDLTRFDWYARGQPLVFEGSSYLPDGAPTPIDARSLAIAGAYDGVDVYRRESDPRLYVPVYDGYWLAFAPAR
jgi:hypothetical protein